MLQYVDGSPWEVTYYSQILGADSEPGPWQMDRSATDQQYLRITNMEVRVTASLSSAEDSVTREMAVTGTATAYPNLKPNFGDMFIADIGDGRSAVFAVVEVRRKTYLRDSYSEIDYQLVNYVDSFPEILANLNQKTIRRAVFYKEFLQYGQNPQLLEGEFADLVDMQKIYKDLVNFYLKDFFSLQYHTLLIPNQSQPAYDPFVTRALMEWLSTEDSPLVIQMCQPVVSANRNADSYTLWSALERMNDSYLNAAIQQMRLLNTNVFRGLPEVSSIYYTGIVYVACPWDARTDVDVPYDDASTAFTTGGSLLGVTGLRWKDLMRYLPSGNLNGFFKQTQQTDAELPDIVPVTIDEYYVLSEKFYRPTGPMASKLEVLTKQALRQEPIDKVTLLSLARSAMQWPNLERFYYMPILFALMKVATRTN